MPWQILVKRRDTNMKDTRVGVRISKMKLAEKSTVLSGRGLSRKLLIQLPTRGEGKETKKKSVSTLKVHGSKYYGQTSHPEPADSRLLIKAPKSMDIVWKDLV